MTKGWWLLSKFPEYSAPKTQTTALRLMCTLLIYPPILCISIMCVTSLNDVTIICFPLLVGKTLHMCSRVMLTCLHICQHPCQLIFNVSLPAHEPIHQFCISNSEPVTLSPKYFSVPLYWSLQFIKGNMSK